MKPISVAVVVAVLAAGLMAGCATTGPTATAALPYQATREGVGLRAQDDAAYSLGHPFRILAFVLYPAGLLVQRLIEVPYVLATRVDPTLFGITELEQQYLQQRWGVRPGPNPDSPPAEPATK